MAGVSTFVVTVVVVAIVALAVYCVGKRGGSKVVQVALAKDIELAVPRSKLRSSSTRSKAALKHSRRKRSSSTAVKRAFRRSRLPTSRRHKPDSKVTIDESGAVSSTVGTVRASEAVSEPLSPALLTPQAIVDTVARVSVHKGFQAILNKKRSKFQHDIKPGAGNSRSNNLRPARSKGVRVSRRVRSRISRRRRQNTPAAMTKAEQLEL